MENYRNFSLFNQFDSDPRFPLFLLYVRWKSGVTFVRRRFRDDRYQPSVSVLEQDYEKNVYPCAVQFYCRKVGCRRVTFTRVCYTDENSGKHQSVVNNPIFPPELLQPNGAMESRNKTRP